MRRAWSGVGERGVAGLGRAGRMAAYMEVDTDSRQSSLDPFALVLAHEPAVDVQAVNL